MSHHIVRFTENDAIYGPIPSRRLGWTLGINPLGHENKVCSYNCPYCELGETVVRISQIQRQIRFQSPEAINSQLKPKLLELEQSSTPLDAICVSGNGEPTLYPYLSELSRLIKESRNELLPSVKIHILTNGAHFNQKKVLIALQHYDFIHVKFDAGSEEIFKAINAPLVRTNIDTILNNLSGMDNLVLQSMFVKGAIDNTKSSDIDSWIECVGIIKPKIIHIYTIDRPPKDSQIEKVDEDTLDIIAAKLKRKLQIDSLLFP